MPLRRLQNEHFDERAPTWTARYQTNRSFRARLGVVGGAVDAALADTRSARVLDYGGGTGIFSALCAQRAALVVCADRSMAMLTSGAINQEATSAILAEAGFGGAPGRVLRVAGDERWLASLSAQFDLVLAIAVLEYVEDCPGLLLSFARLLAPGGRVLLTVPNPDSVLRWTQRLTASVAPQQPSRWRRLADQSFVRMQSHGSQVPWREAAAYARLEVDRVDRVPLGQTGACQFVRPNLLVSLRIRASV
ncbi:class I SAM-dependent methyltransferase [Acidiferrimicrobium sp. IK]|nr:class I SAM-dependent methyltransferase [Acidiferrimicrobium sp. IK]